MFDAYTHRKESTDHRWIKGDINSRLGLCLPSLKEALDLILDMHGPSVVCISVVFLGLRR